MKRVVLVGALSSILATAPAWAAITDPVKIDTGQLSGTSTDTSSVRVFKGIPFAAPPTGENRWRAPQPAAKWDGVRKADAFSGPCTTGAGGGRGGRGGAPGGRGGAPAAPGAPAAAPQAPPAAAQPPREGPGSEDCLYANVWTSAAKASDKHPVIVWIYGGGFTGGSGGQQWYDGEYLASKGAVIVTFNYRLGALGFFAHPELAKEAGHPGSGNYGMMDAIGVLQWVKKNISAFGGDPGNVTIAGESAGAIMVGGLVGSPQAKGLFHRAILESGSYMGLQMARTTSMEQAQGAGVKAMEGAGVKTLAELRAKPLAELGLTGVQAGLVIDGYLIPEDLSTIFANGKQNDVDLLAGSNKDENTFFGGGRGGGGRGGGRGGDGAAAAPVSAADAYAAQAKTRYADLADTYLKLYPATSDAEVAAMNALAQNEEINWNMRQTAAAQAKKGKKAYSYFFTRVPLQNGQPQANGASHTSEISYVFRNAQRGPGVPPDWNDVDKKLSETMSSYWVNFATKGDPNGSGLPVWPQMKDLSKDKVIVLGDTVQVEAAPPAEKLAFFNARHTRLMKSGTN